MHFLSRIASPFRTPHALWMGCVAALTMAIAGCDSSGDDSTSTAPAQDKPAAQADAPQSAKTYTFAQKDEFIAMMKDQMSALDQNIDKLQEKIKQSSDAAKADAQPKLKALQEQKDKLDQACDRAAGATESAWDGVKSDASAQIGAAKQSLADVEKWLKDKMAQ